MQPGVIRYGSRHSKVLSDGGYLKKQSALLALVCGGESDSPTHAAFNSQLVVQLRLMSHPAYHMAGVTGLYGTVWGGARL